MSQVNGNGFHGVDFERSSLLTDASRMKILFQQRLPGFADGALVVDDCEILHTRYRTSKEHRRQGTAFLSVAYELEVRNPASAQKGVQVLHAKAYPSGRSRTMSDLHASDRFPPRFGQAIVQLRDLNVIVWAFPNDPKLHHLPEVMDPQSVRRHLPYDQLPPAFASPERLRDVAIEVVRYKPEVRCTTRYRLRADGAAGAETFTIYGKTFKHGGAPEILRRITSMWIRASEDPHGFLVPKPLGCAPAVKTVWQNGLSGTSLVELVDAHNCEPFLDAAARGLASLHRANLPGLTTTRLSDRIDAVRGEIDEIIEAFPRLRARLLSAVWKLERDMDALPPCRDGLIHGDFLLKQMVVHGDRLGVFDFDNFAAGDSIQDLANFIVDLRYQKFAPELVDRMTATFLRSYRASVEWEVPVDRVNWHVGVQLLRDAYYFLKRKHWTAGFEAELEGLIALANKPAFDEGQGSR